MATQPEHKPNGRPPMADDEASAGRIDAGVSYSRPENAVAAQTLMVGWANDMFTGTQDDGIYLDPSQEFTLDTVAGEATQFALPNSLTNRWGMHSSRSNRRASPTPWPWPAATVDGCLTPLSGRRRGADDAANPVLTETPHQTRRYLLTDGGKRANLLGSMCARVKDASQRPVTSACGG
jgi:hypothetical protein